MQSFGSLQLVKEQPKPTLPHGSSALATQPWKPMLPLTSLCGPLLFFLFLVNTFATGLEFLHSIVVWVLRTAAMFQVHTYSPF